MIEKRWSSGVPYSLSANTADRYLPALLARRSDMAMSPKGAHSLLMKWVAEGVIATEIVDTHSKQKGLRVLRRIDRET